MAATVTETIRATSPIRRQLSDLLALICTCSTLNLLRFIFYTELFKHDLQSPEAGQCKLPNMTERVELESIVMVGMLPNVLEAIILTAFKG